MFGNHGAMYSKRQNNKKHFHLNWKKSTENPQLKIIRKATHFGSSKQQQSVIFTSKAVLNVTEQLIAVNKASRTWRSTTETRIEAASELLVKSQVDRPTIPTNRIVDITVDILVTANLFALLSIERQIWKLWELLRQKTRAFRAPKLVKIIKIFTCGFCKNYVRVWWWHRMNDNCFWGIAPTPQTM